MQERMENVKICSEKAGKDSIAAVLDEQAERIASLSIEIFQQVNSRLQCVSRMSMAEDPKETSYPEAYPPFFESLRSNLLAIERSLNGISDCLDRLEL